MKPKFTMKNDDTQNITLLESPQQAYGLTTAGKRRNYKNSQSNESDFDSYGDEPPENDEL